MKPALKRTLLWTLPWLLLLGLLLWLAWKVAQTPTAPFEYDVIR